MADNDFKTSGEVATIQPTFEGEGTHTQGEDTANKHTSMEPTAVTVHRGMEVEPQPPNRGSRKQNRGSVDGGKLRGKEGKKLEEALLKLFWELWISRKLKNPQTFSVACAGRALGSIKMHL